MDASSKSSGLRQRKRRGGPKFPGRPRHNLRRQVQPLPPSAGAESSDSNSEPGAPKVPGLGSDSDTDSDKEIAPPGSGPPGQFPPTNPVLPGENAPPRNIGAFSEDSDSDAEHRGLPVPPQVHPVPVVTHPGNGLLPANPPAPIPGRQPIGQQPPLPNQPIGEAPGAPLITTLIPIAPPRPTAANPPASHPIHTASPPPRLPVNGDRPPPSPMSTIPPVAVVPPVPTAPAEQAPGNSALQPPQPLPVTTSGAVAVLPVSSQPDVLTGPTTVVEPNPSVVAPALSSITNGGVASVTASPNAQPVVTPAATGGDADRGTAVGITIGVLAMVGILVAAGIIIFKKMRRGKGKPDLEAAAQPSTSTRTSARPATTTLRLSSATTTRPKSAHASRAVKSAILDSYAGSDQNDMETVGYHDEKKVESLPPLPQTVYGSNGQYQAYNPNGAGGLRVAKMGPDGRYVG